MDEVTLNNGQVGMIPQIALLWEEPLHAKIVQERLERDVRFARNARIASGRFSVSETGRGAH